MGQNPVPSHEKFQAVSQDRREFPQQRLFERPQRTLQFTGRGWTLPCGRCGFGTSVASATSFELEAFRHGRNFAKKKQGQSSRLEKEEKMATVHTKTSRTQF